MRRTKLQLADCLVRSSLRSVVNLALLPPTRGAAAVKLAGLLTHPLPWLRLQAAEEVVNRWVGVEGVGEEEEGRVQELVLETAWGEGEVKRGEAEEVGRLVGGGAV